MTVQQTVVEIPVITVDGPGGSGKGTVSMRLASRLGWHFLDSGALYRLVAFVAREKAVSLEAEGELAGIAETLDVEFTSGSEGIRMFLGRRDVGEQIRGNEVSVMASKIATMPLVRQSLVARQRAFRQLPGLVADGRDMGTVIFQDASLKIFLTASAQVRAERRYKQLKQKGESVNLSRLFREIVARDDRDQSRQVAPLRPADDAITIDSTDLSINEVLKVIYELVEERRIVI
jgi:cytidylate kinase